MTSEPSSSDKTPSFEMSWGSSTSSGYCSDEDADPEFEQYFTARTSFFPKGRNDNVKNKTVKKDEQTDSVKEELTTAEVLQKVKEYNAQINSNLFMNMNKDGSYTGFVKVQFKLARPVSVPAPKKGGHDVGGRRASGVKRRTSFYLPKDASKHLHISSRTTSREVIEALLKKFTVVDNPGKFALFQRSERHDQVYVRKLSDEERPLRLRLCSGPNEKVLSFLIKENETGEVNWHAFSMPELKNFLLILHREEEEHVKQIVQRYASARAKMQEALSGSTPG
ncbi:ras association domain-containing protein 1 isoform X2 [Austrofundulus limnaeus]|uniref:Ras association domain-containing protein 1 isoform X2 n=1 Tax=Austrofundulus limnaeus TaxID=52670 RepID=A0A2I4B2A9_AUSLI|nr:PREDICTED: ras association domain-containing protein 1 isoform X2 [Austrofundulus limnaeus]